MSIALARRYRPKRFADLLVQDHVAAVLRGAVARGRVGHGYLLTGPRGVGKTTAARILAMALNCPNRDTGGDPCGECESCLRIWNGSANLDVIEIDAASNRGVDDARDLRERAMYSASQEGHYKVYIVDEAHMLTREAWNALLKILEEPPPRVVFVFATTEPQKIAATAAPVMSRLQRFDFRRIGPGAIRERLRAVLDAEGIAADDDALTLIARHADGGMRDALSVLDQCLSFGDGAVTAARVRETLGLADDELFAEVLDIVATRRPAGVFPLVDRLMESGADLGEFLNGTAEMLRALLMVQVGARPEGLTEAARGLLERYRQQLAAGDVLRMLRLLAENEQAIRRSVNPRLVAETLLLRWAMLDRIVDLEKVVRGGVLPGGGAPPRLQGMPAARTEPVPPAEAPEAAAAALGAVPGSPKPVRASPGAVPTAPDASPAAPAPGLPIAFTLEGLQGAWGTVVAALRERSRFLGEALAMTRPAAVEPPLVRVLLGEANPLSHERLEKQAGTVEETLARLVGAPVRLRVEAPADAGADAEEPTRRLSESGMRSARLKGLRSRDPALDAAVDELDLEIVE
jgi:DNA polymerase-3 subunit gamma/tau